MNQNNKNIKILLSIGGFLFVIAVIGIIVFISNREDKDSNLAENEQTAMIGQGFEKEGEVVFKDFEGKEQKVSKFKVNSESPKEDLVTYKGDDINGIPLYSIEGYDNLFWAHNNNVKKYFEMTYPADRFSVLEITPSDSNELNIDILLHSEMHGEFEVQVQLHLADSKSYMIGYNEYDEIVDDGVRHYINNDGELVEVK